VKYEELLFWIFIVIALFLLIWRYFGSPGMEGVIAALIGAIAALWKEFKGEVREFTGKVKEKLGIK